MKKILLATILTLCILANIFVLSACEDKPITEIVATYGEYVEEQYYITLGEYTYGDDNVINQDIGKIKFYGILEDNSKTEIALRKFKVTYENADKVYESKPKKFTVGEWTVYLTYQNKEYDVYFSVEKSSSGVFTAEIEKSSWKFGEDLPKLRIKNPEGKVVSPVSGEDLLPDDTTLGAGTPNYLGFKKDFYNTLGDEKYDADFLWGVYCDWPFNLIYSNNIVLNYENTYRYRPGEYVLVFFDQVGTYNYTNIVCAVEFTVIDRGTVWLNTFVLSDVQVVDINGGEPNSEYVAMAENLKENNANNTLTFNYDSSVTGTCDFGAGMFDELTGSEAFTSDETVVDGVVVVAMTNGEGATFAGTLEDDKLTLMMQADENTMFVITFTLKQD